MTVTEGQIVEKQVRMIAKRLREKQRMVNDKLYQRAFSAADEFSKRRFCRRFCCAEGASAPTGGW